MAHNRGNLCKFGKECRKIPCERDHQCPFFLRPAGCTKSAGECKYEHNQPRCPFGIACRDDLCVQPHSCSQFDRHGACANGPVCRYAHNGGDGGGTEPVGAGGGAAVPLPPPYYPPVGAGGGAAVPPPYYPPAPPPYHPMALPHQQGAPPLGHPLAPPPHPFAHLPHQPRPQGLPRPFQPASQPLRLQHPPAPHPSYHHPLPNAPHAPPRPPPHSFQLHAHPRAPDPHESEDDDVAYSEYSAGSRAASGDEASGRSSAELGGPGRERARGPRRRHGHGRGRGRGRGSGRGPGHEPHGRGEHPLPRGYDGDLAAFEDALLANPAALVVGSVVAENPAASPHFNPLELDVEKRLATLRIGAAAIRTQLEKVALERSKAQIASLCFVLDCTLSMDSSIAAARDQIESIIRIIQGRGCRLDRVAFVGYRDWGDGPLQFDILPFTSNVGAFKAKLRSVEAFGGGDMPEDVLGGLAKAAKMDWPESSGTRVIFHLGDAPPHGERFFRKGRDDFPDGHPSDMPVPQLFELMASKNIEYYFGEFNNSTDLMKAIFAEACGRPVDEVANSAANLAALTEIVSSSILRAVSGSVLRSSSLKSSGAAARASPAALLRLVPTPPPDWNALPEIDGFHVMMQPTSIDDVREGRGLDVLRKPTSLKIAPQPFAKGSSRFAFFGKNYFRSARSHNAADVEITDMVYKTYIQAAAHADPRMDVSRYLTDLECQNVASQLAYDFSRHLGQKKVPRKYQLRYLKAKLVHFTDPVTGCRRHAMEEKLFRHGMQLVKYTSNSRFVHVSPPAGVVDWQGKLDFLLAFSHFTYQHSQQYLVVTDLQGIIVDDRDAQVVEEETVQDSDEEEEDTVPGAGADGAAAAVVVGGAPGAAGVAKKRAGKKRRFLVLLTDPAIHCARHPRFGPTNLGKSGMEDFVAMHRGQCNHICKALGLTPL